MNRAGKNLATLTAGGPEDCHFRSFFGCSVTVFLIAYNMLIENGLLPSNGKFCHYFWALLFMKLYPRNETELCSLLGGIDPKTMRKWVWPFIDAISELQYSVVSTHGHFYSS